MRKKIIAANWKMNGSIEFVQTILKTLLNQLEYHPHYEVGIFPASIHLFLTQKILKTSSIFWGAQNIYFENSGAFTGEISLPMIKELGCQSVLIGHSERRELFFESNEVVAKKFQAAIFHSIRPILCVGETLAQREAGETENIIHSQLASVVEAVTIDAFQFAAIAYEPVWAIGTGLTATPDQAQAVHQFIREWVEKRNSTIAAQLQILYGGSVKGKNAKALFAMPDVDGALIGGASLDAEEFLAICRVAE